VSRAGLIDAYVDHLATLGRAAGIDAARLAAEVSDHLAEAAAGLRATGMEPAEAERRAVEELGDAEAMVAAVASEVKGGPMSRMTRRTRMVATAGALLATAVLSGIHMDWDSAAAGTPVQSAVVAAGVVLGISILALVAIHTRSGLDRRPRRRVVGWVAACAALGTLSAWGGRVHVGTADLHLAGRPYLASVAFLALLVAWAARWMRLREGPGLGLLLAGGLALLLNSALGGTWRPLGAIGEGQANLGVELILVGWFLLAVAWGTGPAGTSARTRLGGSLVSLGARLSATPPATLETKPGSNP
jgi:hypothetical protein